MAKEAEKIIIAKGGCEREEGELWYADLTKTLAPESMHLQKYDSCFSKI